MRSLLVFGAFFKILGYAEECNVPVFPMAFDDNPDDALTTIFTLRCVETFGENIWVGGRM